MYLPTLLLQRLGRPSLWEQWAEYVYESPIFWLVAAITVFYVLFTRTKKEYHSHWNNLIDKFDYSTEKFYQTFKRELLSHGVSGISTSSVSLYEGNFLSARRRYIRVSWKDYQYDICAAPFGEGFFISWWLLYKTPILQIILYRIPKVGPWFVRKLYPVTYYKIDTASMFMTYCQQSVLSVIDTITNEAGVRSLTEEERKPILKDVFKR